MRNRDLAVAAMVVCWAGFSARAAVTVYTDTVTPATHTLVLEDFNDGVANYTALSADDFTSGTETNGAGIFVTAAGALDPQIIYNPHAPTYVTDIHKWLRMRAQGTSGNATFFPMPAAAATSIAYGPYTVAAYAELRGPFPNQTAAVRTGFRFDPIGDNGGTFGYDYFMLDTFETRGLGEWDRAGDQDGWLVANVTNTAVAGSIFSGQGSGNGDAQMNNAATFDANVLKYVEIRMRNALAGNGIQLYWAQGGGFTGGQSVILGAGDGAFHVYLVDFSQEATWVGTNMRLRLDPCNAVDATFDIDYIRLRAAAFLNPNTFTQAGGTDWNTADNWSLARVPSGAEQPVVDAGHAAVIAAAAPDVGAVAIGGGAAALRITAGGSLTVAGDLNVGNIGSALLTVDGGALAWSGALRVQAGGCTLALEGQAATLTGTRNDGGIGLAIGAGATLAVKPGATGVAPITLAGNALCSLAPTSALSVDLGAYGGGAATNTLIVHNGYAAANGAFGSVSLVGACGMRAAVRYNPTSVQLILTQQDSVPLANPSFEDNTFAGVGYGTPAGWSSTGPGQSGVNPSSTGASPFANNGTRPDRGRVGFIQADGTLSQTLGGLQPGARYWCQLWYNARTADGAGDPTLAVSYAGSAIMPATLNPPVGAGAYHFTNIVFDAPSAFGALTLQSSGGGADNSSLVDAVCVLRRDESEVPIVNPSFEASGRIAANNGQTNGVAGWSFSANSLLSVGVNDASQPFYNNGVTTDGNLVALLQDLHALSQSIGGLRVGQRYSLSYAYNARAGYGAPVLKVTIGAFTAQDGPVMPCEAAGAHTLPFHTASFTFDADAPTLILTFAQTGAATDRTVLIDDIHLRAIPDTGTVLIVR